MGRPRVLAFVLPQFHRIRENDEWWGEGFTEWTNVRRARPLFRGHLQPRVPADDRYYDMLDPQVHDWQADLARSHGIEGFCYYHYWFSDRRLLEKPVLRLLERGKPDFPFCFAWANEPWTRAWDGGEQHVLMPQEYGGEPEWQRHFDALLPAFRDPRYLRIGGRPVFLVYRSASIALCEAMFASWRRLAAEAGLPGLHLLQMLTGFAVDARPGLYDGQVEFEPMYTIRHLPRWFRRREKWRNNWRKLVNAISGQLSHAIHSHNYREVWQQIERRPLPAGHCPGAFVDWDNSPRRGARGSLVLRNFEPAAFERGFAAQYRKAVAAGAPLLFVNAWNEWGEGAYLEPDTARGLFFLDTIRRAVRAAAA